jgi:hypothetical protein
MTFTTDTSDDDSPFAASDSNNDPFNDQANVAPLFAAQMALDPPPHEPGQPTTVNAPFPPTSADSNADADLPRGARAQQFRQSRRLQVSSAFPALAMISIGALLIVSPLWLTPAIVFGLVIAAMGVSLLARFWLNGRRERGLCFLGLSILLWSAFLTAVVARGLLLDRIWPILIMALGLALLCTFLFERIHERSVILPGIALIIAGGIALMFTWPLLSGAWLDSVQSLLVYWPIAAIVLAILLIPRAFSRRVN